MARFAFNPVPEVAPTGPSNAREHIQATPEMFGGLIAGAEQKLGQGIENAGEAGLSALTAKQHLTNEISASETNTWLARNITDKFNDFGRLQGKAAQDALPQFKQDTEDLYQQSLKNAQGNLQMQAMLAKSGRYLTDAYYRYATNHADTQWRTWQSKTADDRANEYGNQAAVAAQHGTWDEVEGFLGVSDDEVAKKLEAQGFDRDSIKGEVAKRRGVNVKNIVETLSANGDPNTARAVFDRYKAKMDAGSVLAISTHLQAIEAQQRGHAVADEETGRVLKPDTREFFKSRSGGARVEGLRTEFADRLGRAAQDYERETGGRAKFESLKRTTEEQAELYHRYVTGKGGLAAPPGQSRHERGEAADIPDGPFLDWMHKNGQRYGLEFLKGKAFEADSGHVQLGAELTGASARDRAQVYDAVVARTQNDPRAQSAAISRMNQIFSVDKQERAADTHAVKGLIEDDVASLRQTGEGVPDPVGLSERIRRIYGENGVGEWQAHREEASAFYGATHDRATLTETEMEQRLGELEPKAGTPNFARMQRIHDEVAKDYTRLRKEREDDPAGSVAGDTTVKKLHAASDPNKPETMQALVEARLSAQNAAGIPEEARSPITRHEALALTAPLRRMLPGQERETVGAMAQQFQQMFGSHADQAFAYALRVHKVDAETSAAAARVVKKLALGEPVAPEEARMADTETDIKAADAAVKGTPSNQPPPFGAQRKGENPGRAIVKGRKGEEGKGGEGKPVPPPPPADDIVALRNNPSLADRFDAKYGPGTAKKILDAYPVAANRRPNYGGQRQPNVM
jgi:hypothetical protein